MVILELLLIAMLSNFMWYIFLKKIVGHMSIFGPLLPLLPSSDDVSFGFESQSGQPYSRLTKYMCHTFPEIQFL